MKPKLVRGTRDFSAEIVNKRNYIFDILRYIFSKYGFNALETPAMEALNTLTGKYGDEGDQLLFKILNNGDFLSKEIIFSFLIIVKCVFCLCLLFFCGPFL